MFVKNDMLSLVYTPAKCLLKNVMCNYRVKLHQRTAPPNTADIKTRVSYSGQKSFAFTSPKRKEMPRAKDGKVCGHLRVGGAWR